MCRFAIILLANFVSYNMGNDRTSAGNEELSFGISPRSNTNGNSAPRRLLGDRKD